MKTKKIFAFACALCIAGGVYNAVPENDIGVNVFAEEAEQSFGALQYIAYSDYVEITNCDNSISGDLMLPASINGKPVESIGDEAFSFCKSLNSITIPESVVYIGHSAFSYCTNLTAVNVSESNKHYCSIDGVLYTKDMTNLIQFPAKKTDTSYSVPEGVKNISKYAFSGCQDIVSIKIPDSVKSIEAFAFEDCSSLTSINIPEGITHLNTALFSRCSSLSAITIPESVKGIDWSVFYCCTKLETVTIPESVETIGMEAFYDCTHLKAIVIKNPECDIDSSNIMKLTEIIGYENSTAQAYAEKNGNQFSPFSSLGDINHDSNIDAVDASNMLSAYAQKATTGDSGLKYGEFITGDVNYDGNVDAVDASLVLMYYADVQTGQTTEELNEYIQKLF